jgi:hypothetical protein
VPTGWPPDGLRAASRWPRGGRVVRALENRTRPSTLSIGAGLVRRNPKYSGFQAIFGVSCFRLQRLGSSVGFGIGTRMAPKKNLRALRVTCRERSALLRPWAPRRALLAQTRGTRLWGYWYVHKIPLSPRRTSGERAGERGISIKRASSPRPSSFMRQEDRKKRSAFWKLSTCVDTNASPSGRGSRT